VLDQEAELKTDQQQQTNGQKSQRRRDGNANPPGRFANRRDAKNNTTRKGAGPNSNNHPAQSAACLIHGERLQNHKRGPQINLKDNTTRPTAEELCLNCVASADFKKCPNKAGFQCLICKAHLKLRLTALPTKTVTAVESTVCHWFCYFLHMVSPEKLSKAGKKGVGSHT
jgi:hypothetical protein